MPAKKPHKGRFLDSLSISGHPEQDERVITALEICGSMCSSVGDLGPLVDYTSGISFQNDCYRVIRETLVTYSGFGSTGKPTGMSDLRHLTCLLTLISSSSPVRSSTAAAF